MYNFDIALRVSLWVPIAMPLSCFAIEVWGGFKKNRIACNNIGHGPTNILKVKL